jgi:hypothetical protein
MAAAVGIEISAEIEAGGRAGAGIGTGQSQAATVFTSSQEQSLSWLSAGHEASAPSVSGTESFRSRWQAMIDGLGTGPGAEPKTGLKAGQGTELGRGQGTAIRTRPGTGTEAESADENADIRGGIGGAQETTLLNFANRNSVAVSPNTANAAPQFNEATEQMSEPVAGVAKPTPASPQSGVSGWRVAASHVKSSAGVQTVEACDDAHTGRSVKSDKRDSTAQRLNAVRRAAASNNGTLATPIAVKANSVAQVPVTQAQIPATNILAAPQSNIADSALSSERVPDTVADAVIGSATTGRNGATGTAGIEARSQINSRAAPGNSVTLTPGRSEDSETSGVQAFAAGDAGASDAKQQAGLTHSTWAQAEATQLKPVSSQPRTGSGNPLVDAAKANSGTYQEKNPKAAESNAFAIQSPYATTVAEKPNLDAAKQLPEEAVTRLAHRDSVGDTAQPEMHVVLAQQDGVGGEASGLVRVPSGTEGTVNAMTAHAGVMAGTAAGTATRETFAAMDAGTEVGTPGWIHAGDQTAEAGFQDPALGWVGVRADLSGSNVHAELMPGSAEAAQTLSGHLAGLNSYLAEQHTPVATLTLAAPGGSGVETGASQSMQQGAGQNLSQDAERNTPTELQSSAQPSAAAIAAMPAPVAAAENGGFDSVVYRGEMRGRHISVMA